MAKRKKTRFSIFLLLFLLLLSFGFFSTNYVKNPLLEKALYKLYYQILYPTQSFLALQLQQLKNWFQLRETKREEQQTVTELQHLLALYRQQLTQLPLLQQENKQLRRLLSYRKKIPYQTVLARVVLVEPQAHFFSFVLSQGSAEGITKGSPVLTLTEAANPFLAPFLTNSPTEQPNTNATLSSTPSPQSAAALLEEYALVGYVYETSRSASKVATILDARTRVSVALGNSLADGVGSGIMQGRAFNSLAPQIDFVDIRLEKLLGKKVYTDGRGEKYPPQLFIGVVTRVEKKNYGLFQRVYVEPAASFFKLKYVFVLTQKTAVAPSP